MGRVGDQACSATLPARVAVGSCDRCDLLVSLPGVHMVTVDEPQHGQLRVVETPAAPMGCRSCGVVAVARGRREVSLTGDTEQGGTADKATTTRGAPPHRLRRLATLAWISAPRLVALLAQVSFRQRLCPAPLLGRMNASVRFVVWGTMPIGAFLGGVLGAQMGIVFVLWLAVVGQVLAVGFVLLSPLVRMRDLPQSLDAHA